MNYTERLMRFDEAMEECGLDAAIYGTGANFQYFSGLSVPWRRGAEPERPAHLLVSVRGEVPRVILAGPGADYGAAAPVETCAVAPDEVVPTLRRHLRGRRVGIDGGPAEDYLRELVGEVLPGAELVNAGALGENLRMCKEDGEIARLREAAAFTDRVMSELVEHIKPGITQGQLGALIAEIGQSLGADGTSFSPTAGFVRSGTEATADPFVYPVDEGLTPGTSIAFDFGFVLNGYCSDFGRSFYCGPAPADISEAYRALQQCQCHLISQMKPGRQTLGELFGIIEEALDERGYGDRLRARLADGNLGHQIGVDLHENPWLKPGCDVPLTPGMVMAIEPKLWLPGEYYLRVEDMVLITGDGAESLTFFDRRKFELPL